jgi:hypothetical protein
MLLRTFKIGFMTHKWVTQPLVTTTVESPKKATGRLHNVVVLSWDWQSDCLGSTLSVLDNLSKVTSSVSVSVAFSLMNIIVAPPT